MTLSERIKIIITEKNLKQVELAESLGVSANYINLIVNGKKLNISETLAKLMEETYGYSSEWILYGTGEKNITNNMNSLKLDTIKKIKKMSDSEVTALLSFIDSWENINNIYNIKEGN